MILADTHFSRDNLERHKPTFEWIADAFNKIRPTQVLILGDILHTRGTVHLSVYDTVCNMLRQFVTANWTPGVHLLVGNHDMLDKHTREVNALTAFGIGQGAITVYSEITPCTIDGVQCIFVPYHEDQSEISRYLARCQQKCDTIVFAHVAVDGTMINGFTNPSHAICKNSGLSIGVFEPFKRTFMGHFHHHRIYGDRDQIMYVGTPLQLTFGDTGDERRGMVVYDVETNTSTHLANPHAVQFVRIPWRKAVSMAKGNRHIEDGDDAIDLENKYLEVVVHVEDKASGFWNLEDQTDVLKKLRTTYRVSRVKWKHVKPEVNSQSNATGDILYDSPTTKFTTGSVNFFSPDSLKRTIEEFVVRTPVSQSINTQRIQYMNGVVDGTNGENTMSFRNHIPPTSHFVADIEKISMYNFMGIGRSGLMIDMGKMDSGVWMIRGRNGSGKSTILEAIAWCLFGHTFRETRADDVVNTAAKQHKRECSVRIDFSNNVTVVRKRLGAKMSLEYIKPDRTKIEHGTVAKTQESLDRLLTIDWRTFSRTVMLSSSHTINFISSSEDQKKAIIEKILGLDILTHYATLVDEDSSRICQHIKETDSTIEDLTRQLKETEMQYDVNKKRIDELDTELREIVGQMEATRDELDNYKKSLIDPTECAQNWTNVVKAQKKQVDLLLETAHNQHAEHDNEQIELSRAIERTQTELDELYSNYINLHRIAVQAHEITHAKKKLIQLLEFQQSAHDANILRLAAKIESLSNEKEQRATLFSVLANAESIRQLLDTRGVVDISQRVLLEILAPVRSLLELTKCPDIVDQELATLNERYASEWEDSKGIEDEIVTLGAEIQMYEGCSAANSLPIEEYTFEAIDPEGFAKYRELSLEICNLRARQSQPKSDENVLAEVRMLQNNIETSEGHLKSQRDRINVQEKDIARMESQAAFQSSTYKMLRDQVDIISCRNKEVVASGLAFSKNIENLKNTRNALKAEEAIILFWKSALTLTKTTRKGLFRSFCMEKKVHEVNEELARNIQVMGDDGDCTFQDLGCYLAGSFVLQETPGALPFNKRSDGQKKRSELALFFALLQRSKAGGTFKPTFMFMDEIYDALDENGQQAIQNWVYEHTDLALGEKTFIITHSDNSSGTGRVQGIIEARWTRVGPNYTLHCPAKKLARSIFTRPT
jgi:DNA repair exonuclease SbcCD ATPase subunit